MAFPVVQTTAESATVTAGTSHVITLPSGIQAGDLILIVLDKGSTAATVNAHADYTELLDENAGNGLYIAYRRAVGGESNPTLVTSANTRTATIAFRISDAENPATQAPQIGTTATGTSLTPDPPSVTPTGGAKDYLWVAFAGMALEEADDDTWANTPPTNFTPSPPLQKSCGTAGTNLGGLILAAYRQANAASQDPGTFGVDTSAAWRAQTIAVHPVPTLPTTVNGGVASENNSVPTGKAQQVYTAAASAETDSAPAGKVLQRYTASPAAESDTALAGTVIQPQIVAGGRALEANSVLAGKVLQTYTGGSASEADSAPTGQVQQRYTAAPAFEADSAPGGSVLQPQVVSGGVASETGLVPAGQVQQVYTASPAGETDSASGGRVLQVYTAAPSLEQDSTPPGTVEQGGPSTTVNGGVASEADSVAGGLVAQIYTAGPASEQDAAIAGAVAELYAGSRVVETDTAPGGIPRQPQLVLAGVAGEQEAVPVGAPVSVGQWTYGPFMGWSYQGAVVATYSGGTASTYSGGSSFTYDGGE